MSRQRNKIKHHADTDGDDASPDDLLMEILAQMPPKSIAKIKCITKLHKSPISDNSFKHTLLLNATGLFYHMVMYNKSKDYIKLKENTHTFVSLGKSINGRASNMDFSLEFLPCHPNFHILDSCNGLLLCIPHLPQEEEKFYVCNPFKKKWVDLPTRKWRWGIWGNAKLVSDSKFSPHFQVVNLPSHTCPPPQMKLEVFSSQTGKWVISRLLSEHPSYCPPAQYIYGGTLYAQFDMRSILAINIKEGTCQEIELPEERNYTKRSSILNAASGGLHYATHDGCLIQVWLLKDGCKKEWILKHETTVGELEKKAHLSICYKESQCKFQILALHPDSDILYLQAHCRVFAYNFGCLVLQEVFCSCLCSHSDPDTDIAYHISVYPFTPCLNKLEICY